MYIYTCHVGFKWISLPSSSAILCYFPGVLVLSGLCGVVRSKSYYSVNITIFYIANTYVQ
jgi:hypothetical protein